MTYKALNGLGPGYLKERLHPYMPACPLKSAGEALLREPSVKEIRRMKSTGTPSTESHCNQSTWLSCTLLVELIVCLAASSRVYLNMRAEPGFGISRHGKNHTDCFCRLQMEEGEERSPVGAVVRIVHTIPSMVYRASISLTGLPVPLRPGLECLYLVLGERDRLGILLVYRAPFCPAVSLSELTETVSDLVLRTPRMLVLGDFNLHAESGLTGAAQDFMASMTAMGLSQHVTGPTHERGHTLDLVFTTGQVEDDLRVKNLCLTPLSWSDHLLVRFVLESGLSLYKSADPIVWARPRSRMDPDGFLGALGEFPADKTGAPVEALVELWNGEMTHRAESALPLGIHLNYGR
ncbi:UvrABC system protein A [Varanus komodoensis]|nr:UvrABC system protein A [Varanus komodoensis]